MWSLAQAECDRGGYVLHTEWTLVPQLLAQLLYCWMLASYALARNTSYGGQGLWGQVAEDGTAPAPS